jgi:hypothetical protein
MYNTPLMTKQCDFRENGKRVKFLARPEKISTSTLASAQLNGTNEQGRRAYSRMPHIRISHSPGRSARCRHYDHLHHTHGLRFYVRWAVRKKK